MLISAYQLFENYPPETFRELAKLFSKTALEVCEGQQYDIDFETRLQVSIPEYLKMIEYKIVWNFVHRINYGLFPAVAT